MYSATFIGLAILPLMTLAQLPTPTKLKVLGCDATVYKQITYTVKTDAMLSPGAGWGASSMDDCISKCLSKPGCTAVDFNGGQVCIPFKNGISDPKATSGFSKSGNTDHAFISCAAPEATKSKVSGCDVSTYKGISFNVDSDALFGPGRGFGATSTDDCVNKCTSEEGCAAVNFISGQNICIPFKTGLTNPATTSSYARDAKTDHAVLSKCGPPEPAKQKLFGCDVSLYKQIEYKVASDLIMDSGKGWVADSFENCVEKCLMNAGCTAVDFNGGSVCIPLKNGLSNPSNAAPKSYGRSGNTDHAFISCPEPKASAPVGCGKQDANYQPAMARKFQRIIGGNEAKAHSWPWQVTLTATDDAGKSFSCGGSLVRVKSNVEESDIIVTAAHCITKKDSKVQFGDDKVNAVAGNHRRDRFDAGEQSRQSAKLLSHPDYRSNGRTVNDIALIKLNKPVKFSDTIRPICLPTQGEALPVGKTCFVAGWGRNNSDNEDETSQVLKQLKVPLHDAATCKKGWSGSYNEDQMVCAGDLNASSGTCQGDSGGMLACQTQSGGGWTLYGATSFGVANGRCLEKGQPSVFARVSSYVDWINKNMALMTSIK